MMLTGWYSRGYGHTSPCAEVGVAETTVAFLDCCHFPGTERREAWLLKAILVAKTHRYFGTPERNRERN